MGPNYNTEFAGVTTTSKVVCPHCNKLVSEEGWRMYGRECPKCRKHFTELERNEHRQKLLNGLNELK